MFSFLEFLDVFRIDKSLCVTIDVSFFGKRTIAGTSTQYMDGIQRLNVMMFPTKQHEIHLQKIETWNPTSYAEGRLLAATATWGWCWLDLHWMVKASERTLRAIEFTNVVLPPISC